MNIAAFADLFKSYCQNYLFKETPESVAKSLSFYHFDSEDITASFRSLKLPALFLSSPENDFGGPDTDNATESYEASFMVFLKLPSNDITKKGEVLNQAKDICDNIIRRMIYDARTSEILEGLNIPGIRSNEISRTGDSLYGWMVSFNIEQSFDGEIRPEVWEDLSA